MNTFQTNRRSFIQTLAAAPLALSAGQVLCGDSDKGGGVLVDTHLHCFGGINDSRFPYHERAPYRPEETATPQHLLKCMDDAGVRYAVVVHPEPYQDDHRYLEYCLQVGKGRLKGTLLLFSDREGSLDKLPELVKRMDVISVRVHAYAPDRLPPFGTPELRRVWELAEANGLAVQLHFEPRYAAGFEPLIREFRNTRVIIDHLGRPFQGTPKEHAVVLKWAEYGNTIMKLSSIPSARSYPHREIGPVIRQLTEAWGAERMIYGGGFGATATGESYRAAFEYARSYLTHLSEAQQAKILGENAVRLLGFSSAR
jgi:predicted TIM-barrel fold metal-dependent hydrolase